MSDLDHVKVGGPPFDWHKFDIFLNGELSSDWIEVNAKEGWGIRYAQNESVEFFQEHNEYATERIAGKFEIRRGAS